MSWRKKQRRKWRIGLRGRKRGKKRASPSAPLPLARSKRGLKKGTNPVTIFGQGNEWEEGSQVNTPKPENVGLTSDDALIIVDVQKDFLPGGSLAVRRGQEVVPAFNRYIEIDQS
jgi:hypothetical protein